MIQELSTTPILNETHSILIFILVEEKRDKFYIIINIIANIIIIGQEFFQADMSNLISLFGSTGKILLVYKNIA